MKKKRNELIIGVFSLLASIILIGGLIFLKEYRFNHHNISITVQFDNAAGLKEGDQVMVAGVRKGSVNTITLQGSVVYIELHIHPDVQLSDDATFLITSSGLVGMKYVEVNPGKSGRPIDLSQPVEGSQYSDMFEVVGVMGDLISDVRLLVGKIDRSMGDDGVLMTLGQTLFEARELMALMRDLVDENRDNFGEAVQNFHTTSEELKDMVQSNRSTVDSTLQQFRASSDRFDTMLSHLEEISESFKVLSDKINSGEGTLGGLVNDQELYDNLQKTTRDINALIEDIKAHPERYIRISVFDF